MEIANALDYEKQHVEKGKVMCVAKFLNRLVFISGLELATGAKGGTRPHRKFQLFDQKLFYLAGCVHGGNLPIY